MIYIEKIEIKVLKNIKLLKEEGYPPSISVDNSTGWTKNFKKFKNRRKRKSVCLRDRKLQHLWLMVKFFKHGT